MLGKENLGYAMKILLLIGIALVSRIVIAQSYVSWNLKFDFDSSTVTKKHESQLNEVLKYIQSNQFAYLRIYGYADTTGSEVYNEELSKRRTVAVFNWINTKYYLKKEDIYYSWIGETTYDYDFHFEKSQPQTRSVDVVVYLKE